MAWIQNFKFHGYSSLRIKRYILYSLYLVAPPWAFNTGSMFGKGIYFADMF